jgi:Cation transport ATPase
VRNATIEALDDEELETEEALAELPFSSSRRWSALELDDAVYVLGAPELFPLGRLEATADDEAAAGRRVVALGTAAALPGGDAPAGLETLGLAVLAEQLREDAREAVEFLQAQGIRVLVLSGDRPSTVAAVAADAGVASDGPPLDGTDLPADDAALRRLLAEHSVIGRIAAGQEARRRAADGGRALRRDGRRRRQRRAGAEGGAARDRAGQRLADGAQRRRLVLVRGDFESIPALLGEGRQVLRNLRGRQIVRLEVRVRDVPHPRDRPDAAGVSAAPAPPDARRSGDDRDPDVLPRARAE